MKITSHIYLMFLYTIFGIAVSTLIFTMSGCEVDTLVETPKIEKIPHDTRITKNEKWEATQVHLVTDELIIENATLTIEPGATIQFANNAGLKVINGGGIIAKGTSDSPIIFTGTESSKGHWKAISFNAGCDSSQCKLIHTVVEYGGAGDSLSAEIMCENASPTISHCHIRSSASNGVFLVGANGPNEFSYNTITLNEQAPILIAAALVSNVDESCDFSGNGMDAIRIYGDGYIQSNTNWPKFNVPYRIAEDLRVKNSILTISPGVKMQFEAGTGLEVMEGGGLWSEGTVTDLITFTGVAAQKGYWEGVSLFDGAKDDVCRLANCVFEYGGGNPQRSSLIYCEYASPDIYSCNILNSIGYGIVFVGNSHPSIFSDNTISQNEKAPIRLPAEQVSIISQGDYFGNADNYIEVLGGNITSNCLWQNPGISYRLIGSINIINNTLTLLPGIKIEMEADVSINVKMGGALRADGTSDQIIFTGSVARPGYWKYIHFNGDCNDVSCFLNACLISYGGGDEGWPACIYCENSSPTITNCRVENSASWGMYLSGDSSPDYTGTTFSGNFRGDIWPSPLSLQIR